MATNKPVIYSLTSTDLSCLGQPMGMEKTSVNYVKYFTAFEKAMVHAEKEFGENIPWTKAKSTRANPFRLCSGDLRHVMYDIEQVKIES